MQFTELLICLRAVSMVHRWWCSRIRADHRAQFDGELVYHVLTLAEVHNAALLKSQPLTEVRPGGDTGSEDASTQRAV